MNKRLRLGNVYENTTPKFTTVILDVNGAAVPSTDVQTFTLTLYDRETLAIVNSRNDTNILNTGGGSMDGSGNFSFQFTAADMAILDSTKSAENRIALFEWTYGGGGVKQGREECEIHILNLNKVP